MTFKSCIDTLGMMKGDHENEVTQFASTAVHLWINFAAFVIEAPLFAEGNDATKGLLTLKIQILRVGIRESMNGAHVDWSRRLSKSESTSRQSSANSLRRYSALHGRI